MEVALLKGCLNFIIKELERAPRRTDLSDYFNVMACVCITSGEGRLKIFSSDISKYYKLL